MTLIVNIADADPLDRLLDPAELEEVMDANAEAVRSGVGLAAVDSSLREQHVQGYAWLIAAEVAKAQARATCWPVSVHLSISLFLFDEQHLAEEGLRRVVRGLLRRGFSLDWHEAPPAPAGTPNAPWGTLRLDRWDNSPYKETA